MLSHGTRVIRNLLEVAVTPVTEDTSTPALVDQVTKMLEVQLDDDEMRSHLYEVDSTCVKFQ